MVPVCCVHVSYCRRLQVEDDVVDCANEIQTKCQDVTSGYSTSQGRRPRHVLSLMPPPPHLTTWVADGGGGGEHGMQISPLPSPARHEISKWVRRDLLVREK